LDHRQYNDITDKELLDRFYQDNNNAWLGILLQRYTILLLGVCMKYLKNEEDAKDGVQQVFLKAINELHKYKVEYFKSWLYMVTKNHCLMKLREKGQVTVGLEAQDVEATEQVDLATALEKNKALNQMELALEQLNEDQQRCVKLFYLEKKTYQQIVELTGYTLMQVKSNIQNGKRNLKIQMQKLHVNE
jgi:RNA polymerase sigma factor (sigma-70 family)